MAESGRIRGFVCATAVTTIHYLGRKDGTNARAEKLVRNLLSILEVAAAHRAVLEGALESRFPDFDDAVAHEAGRLAGVDATTTRNVRDFRRARIPVYAPRELLEVLHATG
jgi:hypothetical protein